MATRDSDGRVKLTINPDFRPRPKPVVCRVRLRPRTQHERVREQNENQTGIKVKVEMPGECPMCLTENQIEEVLEENQWWWHCKTCDHKWNPVDKK